MQNTPGVVFFHGAGLNPSIWKDVITELDCPVLTIAYPRRSPSSFVDYTTAAIEQIENWDTSTFVIVAHSIGAIVALSIAERFSSRLKGFIAIASVIPQSGSSFAGTLPFPQRFILPPILKILGTKPPEATIKSELCNDLSEEQTLKIVQNFHPESVDLYITKIHYSLPDTKRLYVKLTNDIAMPETLQNRMNSNLKAETTLINSGHLPMLSNPKELSRLIKAYLFDGS